MTEEEFIKKETIRTMKKDIAQLQGEPVAEAVIPEPKVTELAIEEEAAAAKAMAAKEKERKRAEIERKKTEEEEVKREEEEEKREIEIEKIKAAAEEKKEVEEEERKKVIAAEAMAAREEEERRKKEEPEIRKKALLEEKEKIEEEKTKIAESFKELAEKKKPLEAEKATILGKLKEVKENFQIIAAQEREIEEKQRLIEEKEEAVKTPSQKKQIEKERWKIEEKRQELEKERWPYDEKINQLDSQLKEVNAKSREIEVKEEELVKKQKEFFEREEKIKLESEKIELKGELQKLEEIEESFETKKAGFSIKLDKVEESLEEVSSRERKIEEEKKLIEEEERAAKELKERRELEKERWEIGEKRREIETERWELEEKKHKIEIQLKRIEGGIQTISEKRNNIIGRIKEIDQGVRIRKKEEEIPEEKVVREEEVEEVEEVEEAIEEEKLEKKIEEEPEALATKKIAEGEVEKRRIEDAKKRIEALKREGEEKKENEEEELKKKEAERRELLARLQRPLEKKKPPVVLPKAPSEFIRIVPKPPSFREKLWVRIFLVSLILVLLFGIGTFWYWFFIARKQPPLITKCQSDTDCPTGQICGPEGNCLTAPPIARCTKDADCPTGQICESTKGICLKEEPGITIPPSLFSVDNTRNLTISVSEELRPLLSQTLQEWQGEGQFTRLIIKNTEENKILGLKEFLEALLVRVPEELYQKLENGFNLFIYSQSEGNRLGFVTKIKNYEGLANLLRNQETTMESDFETFFTLMGKEGAAVFSYFRNAENVQGYTGPNFRYQTLTREDLGILYLTSGDYFVFTSSWKSMEKTIGKLGITGVRVELTTDLKLGDRGYEVELLQTWLAQDPIVYPERIISGNFGPKTQQAVIRLQEKYASEILAPQGLSKGSGIVDSYTRIKLNELYGESGIKPRMTELTTDLRVGDYGEEVKLLQTWLAKDREIYPQAIVSGYFGYLTQQAIVHFQQKYSSEILTPQGLSRGTGIVDSLTRKRLNELYGQ